ncbi:hypothetical protein FXO37_34236 [Capsicum annuum]|nr:hypothetical protein FXO37_34236 [Capsicum annuum]
MAAATCELIWIKQLLRALKFGETGKMELASCCPIRAFQLQSTSAVAYILENLCFYVKSQYYISSEIVFSIVTQAFSGKGLGYLYIEVSQWTSLHRGFHKLHCHIPWSIFLFLLPSYMDVINVIASFIKTHIFSRRRPIDGWKYMIEEIGPNARKGKGSVSRLPSIADTSTRPFREEETSSDTTFFSNLGGTGR